MTSVDSLHFDEYTNAGKVDPNNEQTKVLLSKFCKVAAPIFQAQFASLKPVSYEFLDRCNSKNKQAYFVQVVLTTDSTYFDSRTYMGMFNAISVNGFSFDSASYRRVVQEPAPSPIINTAFEIIATYRSIYPI